MTNYKIRRFHIFPAAKFGCLSGLIIAFLPAFLFSLLVWNAIGTITRWLESIAILELPGILPDLNLLQILNLTEILTTLQNLNDLGWVLVLGLTISFVVLGALWMTLVALFVTIMYNVVAAVSGGLSYSADTMGPAGNVAVAKPTYSAKDAPYLTSAQNPAHRWALLPGRSTIGSATGNTVVISGLAAQQAEIRRDGADYVLDDRSGGQSLINGQPARPGITLRDGDRLRLGPYEFIFHSG